jgi:ubiquinone/menaquinone biosynthesis C-methylase UbiE
MAESGSYHASKSHRDAESEVQRLRAQALLTWEKEARTLAWFGLQDGMSVLELGSGPGFVTEQLLPLLPHSPITALEIDPALIETAQQRLQPKADDRLQFVEASIMDTGLPDNAFDLAYARLIFQHLPDPVSAAREVRRVLKPGGKLVIVDADDAIWGLTDPPIPEMGLVMGLYGQAQAARGGNRCVGRALWRILEAAGFADLDLEAIAAHSDGRGVEPFMPQIDVDRLQPIVRAGLLSGAELEQIRASREAFLAADRPYILMVMLMACGQKP